MPGSFRPVFYQTGHEAAGWHDGSTERRSTIERNDGHAELSFDLWSVPLPD